MSNFYSEYFRAKKSQNLNCELRHRKKFLKIFENLFLKNGILEFWSRALIVSILTDTGENFQKWTRVFSTRRWVISVARTSRKKEKKITRPLLDGFAWGQVWSSRLYRLKYSLYKHLNHHENMIFTRIVFTYYREKLQSSFFLSNKI